MTQQTLTPAQMAVLLQIPRWQVYKLIRTGRIKANNIGSGKKRRIYRIPAREAARWTEGTAA